MARKRDAACLRARRWTAGTMPRYVRAVQAHEEEEAEESEEEEEEEVYDGPARKDILGALPTELVLRMLRYFQPAEIAALARVSKRWRTLVRTNRIWWALCMQHFWDPENRPSR